MASTSAPVPPLPSTGRRSWLGGRPAGDREATAALWFLTGQVNAGDPVRVVPIHISPFRVGRRSDVALCIPSRTVSSVHAEIIDQGDSLVVRDLQSTNGTYVNGRRVTDQIAVKPEDLIQFADVPFRVRRQSSSGTTPTVHEDVCDQAFALVQFDKLMSSRSVIPYYQPIVDMQNAEPIGYEVLGRSEVFGLESPAAMFRAASQLDLEVELSRMFRWEGIRTCAVLDEPPHLFVNTHPRELLEAGLLESLQGIRDVSPRQPLTLEIHEGAVTDVANMNELRAALKDLNVNLAYDDFGEGQNRLIELVEVRPDYLKFDIVLIREIHRAAQPRQQMLEKLVQIVRELGVIPLAEGIECQEEATACRELGFQLAQGFFYGRPAPIRCIDEFQYALRAASTTAIQRRG
jgi:EAL domain-containing protein (putative c-di-GMP-specific phosphodiesterase class I)